MKIYNFVEVESNEVLEQFSTEEEAIKFGKEMEFDSRLFFIEAEEEDGSIERLYFVSDGKVGRIVEDTPQIDWTAFHR